jgi:hypothetical protein
VFGKKGGVNLFKTLRRLDFWQFYKDVIKVDLNNYDLIINDFEPSSSSLTDGFFLGVNATQTKFDKMWL